MITTLKELRAEFWRQHPELSRRRIRNYADTGLMFPTDTRVAFVDWIDGMERSGQVSTALAQRATLTPSRAVFSWEIEQHTDCGWECVNTEKTMSDAKRSIREYRENAPGVYRMRRVRTLESRGN
jgi:hypothetical protein